METARVLFDGGHLPCGPYDPHFYVEHGGLRLPHSSRNATTGSMPMALRAGR